MKRHQNNIFSTIYLIIALFYVQPTTLFSEPKTTQTISNFSKGLGVASLVTLTGTGLGLYKLYAENCKNTQEAPTIKKFTTFIGTILKNLKDPITRIATMNKYPAICAALAVSGTFASAAVVNQLFYNPILQEQPTEKLPSMNISVQSSPCEAREIIKYIEVESSSLQNKYQQLLATHEQLTTQKATQEQEIKQQEQNTTEKIKQLEAELAALKSKLEHTEKALEEAKVLSEEELSKKGIHGLINFEETSRIFNMLEEDINRKKLEQDFITSVAEKNKAQADASNKKLKDRLQQAEGALAQLKAELLATRRTTEQEINKAQTNAQTQQAIAIAAHTRKQQLMAARLQEQQQVQQLAALQAATKQQALETELQKLQAQLQELLQQLATAKKEQTTNKKNLCDKIAKLEQELAQANINAVLDQHTQKQQQKEKEELQRFIKGKEQTFNKENQKLQTELAALRAQLATLQQQQTAQIITENEFIEDVRDLEEKLAQARGEIQAVARNKDQELNELKRQLAQARTQAAQQAQIASAQNAALETQLAAQKKEIKIKDKKIKELEQELRDQESSSSSDDEEALEELQAKLDQQKRDFEKAKQNLEAQLKTTTNDLTYAQTITKAGQEARIKEAKDALAAEQEKNRLNKDALEKALKELKDLREDDKWKQYEIKLKKYSADLADRENQRLAAERAKQQQETTTAADNERLKREAKAHQQKEKELEETIKKLKQSLEEQNSKFRSELQMMIDQEKQRITQRERTLRKAKAEITTAINGIEAAFNIYNREMGAITSHCDRIRTENYVSLPSPVKASLEKLSALEQQLQQALNLVST